MPVQKDKPRSLLSFRLNHRQPRELRYFSCITPTHPGLKRNNWQRTGTEKATIPWRRIKRKILEKEAARDISSWKIGKICTLVALAYDAEGCRALQDDHVLEKLSSRSRHCPPPQKKMIKRSLTIMEVWFATKIWLAFRVGITPWNLMTAEKN